MKEKKKRTSPLNYETATELFTVSLQATCTGRGGDGEIGPRKGTIHVAQTVANSQMPRVPGCHVTHFRQTHGSAPAETQLEAQAIEAQNRAGPVRNGFKQAKETGGGGGKQRGEASQALGAGRRDMGGQEFGSGGRRR